MQVPPELQREMVSLIEQTKRRSGWSAGRTLEVLAISRSTYQRWLQSTARPTTSPRSGPDNLYALLPAERQAVIEYALGHPEVRHREDRDNSATVILVLCVLGVVIWLYIQRRRYYRRVWRGGLNDTGFWGSLLQEMARNSSSSNWSGGSFGGGFGGGSSGGGSFGGGGGGSSGGGGGGASW